MRKQILLGSFTGGIQIVLNSILIFITIPIFINELGLKVYSIFSLLLLIGNLNVFFNLGFNSSLIKYLAEQGKTTQSNHDIVSSFVFLLFLLVPITVVGILYNEFILRYIFNIENRYLTNDVRRLFNLLFISNSILILGQVFTALLDSQQKVYLNNLLFMVYNFLYWGLILLCLFIYPNIFIMGVCIFFSSIVWFGLTLIFSIRIWGSLKVDNFLGHFIPTVKKHLLYGGKLYLSGTITFFYEPLTKILISQFIGLNEVGFFDIATRIRNQVWNLIGKLFYPIFPLIAKLSDRALIRNLIHDVEQKAAFLIIPILISTIFIAKPLFILWIGQNVFEISLTSAAILFAYLIASLVIPNYQFLMLKGYPGKTIIMQALNVLVNGSLFFIFLPLLHYYAVIISNVGAIFSSFLLSLYYQKKYLNSLIFNNRKQFYQFLIIILGNVLAGSILQNFIENNLFKVIIIPVVLILISIVGYRELKIFTAGTFAVYSGANTSMHKFIEKILVKSSSH